MSQSRPRWRAPLQEGCLDRRAELPQTQLLHKAARTAKHHTRVDLHHLPPLVADLNDLGIKEMLGSDQPWFRLAPHPPAPAATIDNAQHLEQGCAISFPAIREKEGKFPHAGRHRPRAKTSSPSPGPYGSTLLGADGVSNGLRPTAPRARPPHGPLDDGGSQHAGPRRAASGARF